MNLGKNLIKLRESSGLSQKELAKKLDVPCEWVVKWKLNELVPELEKLILISKLYNITLDELIDDDINNIHCTEKTNIESAIEEWHKTQRMAILLFAGIILIVISSATIVILSAFRGAVTGLGYSLYRYITVNEYANPMTSYTYSEKATCC